MKNLLNQEININEVMEAAQSLVRGEFAYFEIVTIPSMRKTNNPFIGDCLKFTKIDCQCGVNYKKSLESHSGVQDIEVEPMSGKHHISWIIAQSNTNPNQYYLCLQKVTGAYQVEEYRHLDGTPYTDVETAYLESFLYEKKDSPKQVGLGLVGEKQRKPFQPKLENVLLMKQGGKVVYQAEKVAAFSTAK